MPTQSIIAACQTKFAGLSAALFPGGVRPALYFDEAPVVSPSGEQVHASTQGYVVLKDHGQDVKPLSFQLATREVAKFDFEIYYPSLGDCDAAALAIKRAGGTTAERSGFDFGTLGDLAPPRSTLVIRRVREKRSFAGMGKTGSPVHVCVLSYHIEIVEDA